MILDTNVSDEKVKKEIEKIEKHLSEQVGPNIKSLVTTAFDQENELLDNFSYLIDYEKHKKSHKKHNYMVGMASFYGEKDGFNGQKMANGEVFNTNSVWSSAHPTLPLGTKLRVTNLENGRSLYVEVTDRMPKSSGRVIDLSKSAALDLGMHKKGLTKVRLEVVSSKTFEERKKYLEVDDNDNGRPY